MSMLIATVGLPGSGKSTWARQWVAEDPAHRARVNRDDLRAMLRGQLVWGDRDLEEQVTVAQRAAVAALLATGISVVVDDTNLVAKHRQQLEAIARECGAEVIIRRFDVDVNTCIARDATRPPGERVGAEVIRAMAAAAE